jgi:phage N-6-adenine-methyltransferase
VTLGSHQRCVGKSQVHLTPRWIIDALGPFDLDPCAASERPWDCARENYTEADDGLSKSWHGMVWLNPPFDRYQVGQWLAKLAAHDNGIALVHARTEAMWFRPIWEAASLVCFLDKRIKFCRPNGVEQRANSGAPVVIAAFGEEASKRLSVSGIGGFLIYPRSWMGRAA